MAWLHDLRDAVQEVLEWASQQPCTCRNRADEWTHERCWPHRAHFALGGLYWYGVPNRRFPRPLMPRYTPAHTVLVAHDWQNEVDEHGFRVRTHHVEGCRIWCQNCGAIAPGGCMAPEAGYRRAERGETLYWWSDLGWSRRPNQSLEDPKPCTWLLARHFELAPRPQDAPEYLTDLRESAGEDRGLPAGQYRRPS